MSDMLLYAIDLVAISILVFGLYLPRHQRRDMVVAYLVANVGVMAVAAALASSTIVAGLGLGLFGILSIIRLRSAELDQSEVAYYFAALALGLMGGINVSPDWLTPALMGAILLAIYVGDHPDLRRRNRVHQVTLDRAYPDEGDLTAALEDLLGATIHHVKVRKLDLVRDLTIVEVRYELPGPSSFLRIPLTTTQRQDHR